jgi:hypothetical protein
VPDLLKVNEVECRDSHQRREQDHDSDVLDHTKLVIVRISLQILVSRQINQLANIVPGIAGGTLTVFIGIVSPPELQNLAAAVVLPLWLAACHRDDQHRSLILKLREAIHVPGLRL